MPDDENGMRTPKLRFPEFREARNWERLNLEAALDFQPGFPFPSAGFNEERMGPRLIRNRDLRSDDKIIYYSGTFDDEFVVNNGDVLVGMDGDFTPCLWNKGRALLNQRVGRILPKAGSHLRFLFYFLHAHLNDIEESTARTTVKHLSHSDVEKLCEPLPSFGEQQKIAECLTSLDEVIAAQGRKVGTLDAHKKGLMQQLFPREGEPLPRLRFPDFRDDSRSEFKRVGKFAKVTTGDKDTQNRVADGKYPFFVRSQNVERIDSFSYEGEAVLTSGDGVGVGENYHYIKGKFDFHQRVYCIYDFDAHASGQFFFHYFTLHFKKRVKQMSAKNSVDSVRMAMITEMPIWMPALAEQQRIAACLSSLDAGIAAEAEKLAGLKTHKKGLMQQLFPSRKGD